GDRPMCATLLDGRDESRPYGMPDRCAHREEEKMQLRQHTHIRITLLALLIFAVVAVTVLWHQASLGNITNPCTTTATSITNTNAPPPLYLGLDAYRHWDKL